MPPSLTLLAVPYDSGFRAVRMGYGPLAIRAAGAADRLRRAGYAVNEAIIEAGPGLHPEIATAFRLHSALSDAVRQVLEAGALPIVLSGNCGTAVGTVSALSAEAGSDSTRKPVGRLGVVWLDAHADFNTPETTTSGFLDGMGLATLAGDCWRAMATSVPGFCPVLGRHIALIGARDMSRVERMNLERAGITLVSPDAIRATSIRDVITPVLERWREEGVARVYLHIDLDVHDPASVGAANEYAAPGGLAVAEVHEVVRATAQSLPIGAAGLASYDPECDTGGNIRDAALDLLEVIGAAAGSDRGIG
jgi:arginase